MATESITGYQISPQQKRLWLLMQQAEQHCPYRTQCAVIMEGRLDRNLLISSLQQTANRHEILRTAFSLLPGVSIPLQIIRGDTNLSVAEYDLDNKSSTEQQAILGELFQAGKLLHFDLENGQALHVSIVRMESSRHVLLLTLPALYADAISCSNL